MKPTALIRLKKLCFGNRWIIKGGQRRIDGGRWTVLGDVPLPWCARLQMHLHLHLHHAVTQNHCVTIGGRRAPHTGAWGKMWSTYITAACVVSSRWRGDVCIMIDQEQWVITNPNSTRILPFQPYGWSDRFENFYLISTKVEEGCRIYINDIYLFNLRGTGCTLKCYNDSPLLNSGKGSSHVKPHEHLLGHGIFNVPYNKRRRKLRSPIPAFDETKTSL